MTPEERWQRIEEKHLALTESIELLTDDVHALQEQQRDQAARERILREALLSGVAVFLRELGRPPEAG